MRSRRKEALMKRQLREKLLNMAGYYWWPPKQDDPSVKGPQPHLITREQYEALMKMREDVGEDRQDEPSVGLASDE